MPLCLTPLEQEDAPEAGRILYEAFNGIAEKHAFPRRLDTLDFARTWIRGLLRIPAAIGLGARRDGRLVGLGYLQPRGESASIGPVAVDPEEQASGIGRRIMEALIETAKGHATLLLMQEAFNVISFSLYHKLGFEARGVFLALRGKPPRARLESGAGTTIREIHPADLDEIAAFDEKLTGLSRRSDLEFLLRYGNAVCALEGETLRGFGFGIGGKEGWNIGPIVTRDGATAEEILYAIRGEGDGPMFIRVDARRPDFVNRLFRQGFILDTIGTLMVRGRYRPPEAVSLPSLFPEVLA